MTDQYFDVIIVGAGLAGIGAACHLQKHCPNKSYAILEGRKSMGGTWDLFRYPGIRSDSDMHTLGYKFKPWRAAEAIADGPAILDYMKETAQEFGVAGHIHYQHRVKKASWSSENASWTIEAERTDTNASVTFRCNFIMMCAGYYDYEQGYTPEFKGRDRFKGQIVHPQLWPENLNYAGKKIIIIGSGATAVTLVPAMAEDAAHVVMLQRSPSYVLSLPGKDRLANFLRKILPEKIAFAIIRWKNIVLGQKFYTMSREKPEKIKQFLFRRLRKALGPEYDLKTHFTPRYSPWDQRLCIVPDGDMFQSIKSGKASVVTDHIDTFTEDGILLNSGRTLEADIIVTATGLRLLHLGGVEIEVDDRPVNFSDTFSYKGMMYSDVPNLMSTFVYVNASSTLRSDLNAEYTCRLLKHMDQTGYRQCMPRVTARDKDMPARDWISSFSSSYVQRDMHKFPRQGDRNPWIHTQNYAQDRILTLREPIEDGVMQFSNPSPKTQAVADSPAS